RPGRGGQAKPSRRDHDHPMASECRVNITPYRWQLLNAACTRKECRANPMSFPVLIEILQLFESESDERAVKIGEFAELLRMRTHTFRNALHALEAAGILVLVRKQSRRVRVYRLGNVRNRAREGPY